MDEIHALSERLQDFLLWKPGIERSHLHIAQRTLRQAFEPVLDWRCRPDLLGRRSYDERILSSKMFWLSFTNMAQIDLSHNHGRTFLAQQLSPGQFVLYYRAASHR